MCWCSWLRTDASWLQWISSKNYSINSAAVAVDGISAGKTRQHWLTSTINGCPHSYTGSQNHGAEGCQKQELPTPYYSHDHISIKLDGSFRVKSTYIKILTGVCKGFLTSSSYQKHLSTGVSPQCITANPRSVPQGSWNKHSTFGR